MLFKQDRRRYKRGLTQARSWFKTRNGTKLHVRLLRPDDARLLIELFDCLSPESRWRRFHTNVEHVSRDVVEEQAVELADVDNLSQVGAVAATLRDAEGEHIVGVVRLARPQAEPDSPEAEAAIVVRDDFQGQGVGTELLRRMVLLAKQMQLQTIVAIFQPDNENAIRLFRNLNLPTKIEIEQGATEMRIQVPYYSALRYA